MSDEDRQTLTELLRCLLTHDGRVRVLGNVQAQDAATAIGNALELFAENERLKARLDWLLDDYRGVDLYNAIGVLNSDDKEACYKAIDAALKEGER